MPLLFSALAGVLAAACVVEERVGLALAAVIALLVAVGALVAPPSRWRVALAGLGLALALGPVLRDATWVVTLDLVAAGIAAGALAVAPATWQALVRAVLAPGRVVAGAVLWFGLAADRAPRRTAAWWPVLRGAGLGVLLVGVFGGLFAAADAAFARLAGDAISVDVDDTLLWRGVLGLTIGCSGAALVAAARRRAEGPQRPGRAPGVTELRVALGALVVLFAAFVLVQLRVMFGGADYVRSTTGLGLGDYARQGFAALAVVSALTLLVVGWAARRRDRVVRALLAALCGLCLVVLASAHARLDLVVDEYGLTRVRVFGQALVPWFAGLFVLVLAAGVWPRVARVAPRAALTGTLAAVLAFSLSNPDGRVVSHAARTGTVDTWYLAGLSADALGAAERLPEPARSEVVESLRGHLDEPDGLAGFNLVRALER